MRKWVVLALVFVSPVWADSTSLNLQLPAGPTSYQSDKFRAGNLDCSNAIGGGTNLEFGVTGVLNNVGNPYDELNRSLNESRDVGVYARIVIPLDKPKQRINCNTLYQLELQQRRLEIRKLEMELENLRSLTSDETNFEN
jgi:hypothetical protein